MKIEILIKNINDKIIQLKAVCRASIISKRSYGFVALCAKQALASNDYKRMERNLRDLCIQCGGNPDIDWELKFY